MSEADFEDDEDDEDDTDGDEQGLDEPIDIRGLVQGNGRRARNDAAPNDSQPPSKRAKQRR